MQTIRPIISQFIAFAIVGLFGTAAHYLVLWILVEFVAVAVVSATTAGFLVGALVNYVLNRRFTFSSRSSHVAALPKFIIVAFIGAVINALVVMWLLAITNIHYLIIQLFATGTVLVWNFGANYVWTFRS